MRHDAGRQAQSAPHSSARVSTAEYDTITLTLFSTRHTCLLPASTPVRIIQCSGRSDMGTCIRGLCRAQHVSGREQTIAMRTTWQTESINMAIYMACEYPVSTGNTRACSDVCSSSCSCVLTPAGSGALLRTSDARTEALNRGCQHVRPQLNTYRGDGMSAPGCREG